VLRLMATFSQTQEEHATAKALSLGAISLEAVKMLLMTRLENRPAKLDRTLYSTSEQRLCPNFRFIVACKVHFFDHDSGNTPGCGASASPRRSAYSKIATSIRAVTDRRSLSASFCANFRTCSSKRVVNGLLTMSVHCTCNLSIRVYSTLAACAVQCGW
jgi:hypothetical protein